MTGTMMGRVLVIATGSKFRPQSVRRTGPIAWPVPTMRTCSQPAQKIQLPFVNGNYNFRAGRRRGR